MTPYEAWTKEKPGVGHLRVFGCDAYAHVPKEERRKLDPKAKKYILVGYGEETKGYRLYDPTRGKIIFSRDIVFKESQCNGEGDVTELEVEQYVQLDFLSDEPQSQSHQDHYQLKQNQLIPHQLSQQLSFHRQLFVVQRERSNLQTTLDGG